MLLGVRSQRPPGRSLEKYIGVFAVKAEGEQLGGFKSALLIKGHIFHRAVAVEILGARHVAAISVAKNGRLPPKPVDRELPENRREDRKPFAGRCM